MAVTVSQLKSLVAQDIDAAIDKTLDEMSWPHLPNETVSFYDLMKIIQNLKINLKECLST
jgi:hypothetical protein